MTTDKGIDPSFTLLRMSISCLTSDLLNEVFTFFTVEEVAIFSRLNRHIRFSIYNNNTFWFRYVNESFLIPRITERSKHRGPVSLCGCLLFDDSMMKEDKRHLYTSSSITCKTLHDVSNYTRIFLSALVRTTRENGNGICERSIDLDLFEKHLQHWTTRLPQHFTFRSFSKSQSEQLLKSRVDAAYYKRHGLTCFLKNHYTGLERETTYVEYDTSLNYRKLVLDKVLGDLRSQIIYDGQEYELDQNKNRVIKAYKTLCIAAPEVLRIITSRQRLIQRYTPLDQEEKTSSISIDFGEHSEPLTRLLLEFFAPAEQRLQFNRH